MTDTPRYTQAGKLYFGFVCKNSKCGLPIVIGEIPRESLDAEGGVEIASHRSEHEIACPGCGHKAVYRHSELQRFQASKKDKLH